MVDSRLLQANERTLLAWVRTSIALMTFGFVLARVGVWLRRLAAGAAARHDVGPTWVGALLVGMSVVANALAIVHYAARRRAIRRGEELPGDPLPLIVSVLATVFGGIIAAYLVVRLR